MCCTRERPRFESQQGRIPVRRVAERPPYANDERRDDENGGFTADFGLVRSHAVQEGPGQLQRAGVR